MIMQSRRWILLTPIVPIEDLAMVAPARITKVRFTVSRALDQVESSPSIQTKQKIVKSLTELHCTAAKKGLQK